MLSFIHIRFLDIIDILLVAFLLYQVYRLIKGTVAFNIVIGFFLVYIVWVIVRSLGMELLSSIIGQFIGVGVLALIIIFHPEIRRFLIYIGSQNHLIRLLSLDKLFHMGKSNNLDGIIPEIANTAFYFSRTLTGSIIVIARLSELIEQINTGEIINARISQPLLSTIFFKNTPLHDGAVIIKNNTIVAAGCILPLTHKEPDKSMGLRHRAALGITETTDAIALVVSEETGAVSVVESGNIKKIGNKEELLNFLNECLTGHEKQNPSLPPVVAGSGISSELS
jgi:diadenylate cyclase